MIGFRISQKLVLPAESALWTFADLAIKGAGKTYAACILAEELVKAGIPIISIDGLGIWWGLRVGVDGHEGLPIVVFGGDHKDLSIPTKIERGRPLVDEDRLKLMVKAILEARMSAILDTSEFSKGMQRRIVAVFVDELFHLNAPYGVRHVFIEEADMWCPQKVTGDIAASAGAIDDLVRRGGNFNLGCTLITQRSAVLNKDVLTQANCLIVLRILHKLDKKAVQTWVESMARPDDPRIKKWYDSLKDLRDGEAWLWHPQKPEIFDRIQFRKRTTLHATREYFRQAEFQQKDIRMMEVGEFVERFKKVFEPKPKEPAKQYPFVPGITVERTVVPTRPPIQEKPILLPNSEIKPEIMVKTTPQTQPQPSWVNEPDPITPRGGPDPIVQQALPNIRIEQFKPTLGIAVEALDQPTTPLGRVAVVLKNDPNNPARWTIKRIVKDIQDHGWDAGDTGEVVNQLLRWEILKKQSDGYLRFFPGRIQIINHEATLGAQ